MDTKVYNYIQEMQITSSAFTNGGEIPDVYSCDGNNVNPPLTFSDVPAGAQSLTLLISDLDAVNKVPFYHWVVFNIEATINIISQNSVPSGASVGKNDFGKSGFDGPCPPEGSGIHRYTFGLYALDSKLDLYDGSAAETVLQNMSGHILATAEITGTFSKGN